MPDFLILGAQKAATTSLHQALRRVPGVHMPEGESPFVEDPDHLCRPWESFRIPGRLCGIKRPDLLCNDLLIERVAAALPEARFIVVLREPVGRAVSAYFHLMRHGHLPWRPPDAGLADCVSAHRRGEDTMQASVVRYGLYGHYLARWFELYPPERFLVLSQEAVARDPGGALARCCAHLGLPGGAPASRPVRRDNAGLFAPGPVRLHRWGHLLRTTPLAGGARRLPARNPLRRAAGAGLVALARGLAPRADRAPPLAPATRAALAAVYAEDYPRLAGLVPAEALGWSFPAEPAAEASA